MTSSLYIHIPFCAAKCDYCDFFSIPVNSSRDADVMDTFIEAVLGDVKEQFAFFNVDHVPSMYIGGGTPSVMGAARMERLLAGLRVLLEPMKKPCVECTVEANPESLDKDFLQACVDGGVNRISLGVQTFHEAPRRALHRIGALNALEDRIALAAWYFPNSFSVDLITGLPFQTVDSALNDIERLLVFRPVHVSLYSLIIEQETPLGRLVSRHGAAALSLPNEDDADTQWISARDRLEQAGLAQYEVSNFSLPYKTCAHNIRYWRMENWLGAGPAASGTIINDEAGSGVRRTYPADINAYFALPHIHAAHTELIDRPNLIRESLLMGFRYRKGPDPLSFRRRFGCGIEDCIPKTIARWRERAFFSDVRDESLVVSHDGLLFLNAFLRDAFAEIEYTCFD